MKIKIEDGDKCYIGGTCLIRMKDDIKSEYRGGWIFQGSDDDMYYNGHLIEWDEKLQDYFYDDENKKFVF